MVTPSDTQTPPPCPCCGSTQVIPIIYGMPDEELVLQDAQGTAKIGGVAEYDDSPTWHCQNCKHEWCQAAAGADTSKAAGLSPEEASALRTEIDHPPA